MKTYNRSDITKSESHLFIISFHLTKFLCKVASVISLKNQRFFILFEVCFFFVFLYLDGRCYKIRRVPSMNVLMTDIMPHFICNKTIYVLQIMFCCCTRVQCLIKLSLCYQLVSSGELFSSCKDWCTNDQISHWMINDKIIQKLSQLKLWALNNIAYKNWSTKELNYIYS